jgi:hypothetical protein
MALADELVRTAAERACLEALRALAGGPESAMERHCVRQFLIAERLGERAGVTADREVLLCAALLHDAGVYPEVSTGDVYVTDGRRLAERTLAPFGWEPARLTRCLDAIEQHHARESRWDWGAEVELMRRSDLVDLTRGLVSCGLPRPWLAQLFRRVPRRGFYGGVALALLRMAWERPRTLTRIMTPRQ